MKGLYFECSSGISGNMTLGALVEIVGDKEYLLNELKKLNIDGYKIEISKKVKNEITGTYVDVILEEHHHEHHHEHNHDKLQEEHGHHTHHHEHRNLEDVYKIIDASFLEQSTKELAKKIFLKVANAEAKVHNKPINEVHFHEVGAIDSIIDIVGTAILINKIKPEKIISSIVNDGQGFIECAHGKMAVPVPATSEIFASSNVKFKQINEETELVTPTGAAIISTLAEEFKTLPTMKVEKIGWGVGSRELTIPNVLKVYYGEIEEKKNIENDSFVVMETNIDDCSGEILGYTLEKLLENGALDAFYTPIYMKKNRPAYKLTVCAKMGKLKTLANIIFKETTTIGIRYRVENRIELSREILEADTKYGKIKVKKVKNNSEEYFYPEYESVKKLAEKTGIALKEIYKEI